jgi:hypothetical protein
MQRVTGTTNAGFITDRGPRLIVDDDDDGDGMMTDVQYDDDRYIYILG